ncbi:Crp/Fnr family transcriptional regulator [Dankookia sp. GCM10030260]|uniref:Crp/Fnr family transcriptional regulator n=1 Tax=Dankookia sp. GCM10030260 TaxID=3273390 RepID=UPI003621DEDC
MSSRSAPNVGGNRFLAALSRTERALAQGAAEPVELPAGATLFVPGDEVRHVIFPAAGLVSLLVDIPGENGVEVGLVGREGVVGLHALLGDAVASVRAVVQVRGHGHRVEATPLARWARNSHNLHSVLMRCACAALLQASCAAACNAAHPLEQRTARWLLSVADRVGSGFPITQEFLATMLGTHRPTLNRVLVGLRQAGLIRSMRGHIAVADRARLEAASCPCYWMARKEQERLFPGSFGKA